MTISLDDIQQAALQLPLALRAQLAHTLLSSLDDATEEEDVEELWAEEVAIRAEKVLSGAYDATDWEASLERVKAQLAGTRQG
jgi:hypothetical protein